MSVGVFFIIILLFYLTFGKSGSNSGATTLPVENQMLPDNDDEDVEDEEMDADDEER